MDLRVIDNFLPPYQFKKIQDLMVRKESKFPWYWSDHVVDNGDSFYQFYHIFYQNGPTHFFSELNSINSFLKIKKISRIVAVLYPKTVFNRRTGYHIDYPNQITSIFYLNTNNGYTKFKGHGKVKSVENRMVIFDSNLEHQGVTCTDKKRRVIINFNYENN